jgi:hypothetical protein
MVIAFLVLILCLALSLMVVAIRRSPLVRAVALSFNCWAEHARFDAGELS